MKTIKLLKDQEIQYLIQIGNGHEVYSVKIMVDMPNTIPALLIKKAISDYGTREFEVNGVSATPSFWTITLTLDGQETSKGLYIRKSHQETIDYPWRYKCDEKELLDVDETAMVLNNLNRIVGV